MKPHNWRPWCGLLLIAGAAFASWWAVGHYQRPGHMSVLEAQSADMTAMRPPAAPIPVTAVTVRRAPFAASVTYPGVSVAYQDTDISARIQGTIVSMNLYPGMKVRRGEVIVRIDPGELDSKVNEQRAAVTMAHHDVDIAISRSDQARQAADQAGHQAAAAKSDVSAAQTALDTATAELTAAEADVASAHSDVDSAAAGIDEASAAVAAANADVAYWQANLKRSSLLLDASVISRNQHQQDVDRAANASASLQQVNARRRQAEAAQSAAQSRVKRADAMRAAALAHIEQARAMLAGSREKLLEMQANAAAMHSASATASHEIEHSRAGIRMAEAQLATAGVEAGYAEIRSPINGVVSKRMVSPGTPVQPGQVILTVSVTDPIRYQAEVAEADSARVHIGSTVTVWDEKAGLASIQARVTSIFPTADPASHTVTVEAICRNFSGFSPGRSISMRIDAPAHSALTVPAGAVVDTPKQEGATATSESHAVWVMVASTKGKTVYTCTMHPEVRQDRPGNCPKCGMPLTPLATGGDYRAHLVPVHLRLASVGIVEVTGITNGDLVITSGLESLQEGAAVDAANQ